MQQELTHGGLEKQKAIKKKKKKERKKAYQRWDKGGTKTLVARWRQDIERDLWRERGWQWGERELGLFSIVRVCVISKSYLKNSDNIQTQPDYLLPINNLVLPGTFGLDSVGYQSVIKYITLGRLNRKLEILRLEVHYQGIKVTKLVLIALKNMIWQNAISETQNTFLQTIKKFDMAKGKY